VNPETKTILWNQFGAAIDMLERAIRACPDDLWGDRSRDPEVWAVANHALFWLDLYLSGPVEGFRPPEPFGLEELDPAGVLPPRVYSREELLRYLEHGREKCRTALAALTGAKAAERQRYPWGEVSYGELLLYNLRHVQHHTAQINLVLRQVTDSAPGWVGRTQAGPLPG